MQPHQKYSIAQEQNNTQFLAYCLFDSLNTPNWLQNGGVVSHGIVCGKQTAQWDKAQWDKIIGNGPFCSVVGG